MHNVQWCAYWPGLLWKRDFILKNFLFKYTNNNKISISLYLVSSSIFSKTFCFPFWSHFAFWDVWWALYSQLTLWQGGSLHKLTLLVWFLLERSSSAQIATVSRWINIYQQPWENDSFNTYCKDKPVKVWMMSDMSTRWN